MIEFKATVENVRIMELKLDTTSEKKMLANDYPVVATAWIDLKSNGVFPDVPNLRGKTVRVIIED